MVFALCTFAEAQEYSLGYDDDGDEWSVNMALNRKQGSTVFSALEVALKSGATMAVFTEFKCDRNRFKVHKFVVYFRGRRIAEEEQRMTYIEPFKQYAVAYNLICKTDSM